MGDTSSIRRELASYPTEATRHEHVSSAVDEAAIARVGGWHNRPATPAENAGGFPPASGSRLAPPGRSTMAVSDGAARASENGRGHSAGRAADQRAALRTLEA